MWLALRAVWRFSQRRFTPFLLGIVIVLCSLLILHSQLFSADLDWSNSHHGQSVGTFDAPALVNAGSPTLFVHGGLATNAGDLVEVPIAFDSFGAHVAALSFSLDYDQECLTLQPDDKNADGVPDAFVIRAPSQFFPSVAWDPSDQDGEFDVVLADYIPPLSALPDTAALFTIQFRTSCPVAQGLRQEAVVRFAAVPAVGFSDPGGRELPGIARGGVVQVIGAGDATATPIQTPLPPSPAPTVTLIPTAPSTPTPAPVVFLELATWPEIVTRADRGIVLSLDYLILTTVRDVSLNILLPPHVQFNAVTSTVGWQCDYSAASPQCQFPLYTQTVQNSMSGRIFFGVLLGGLLPGTVTHLEFTVTQTINGTAGTLTQQVLLPVLPADATPPPRGELELDLQSHSTDLLVGRDRVIAYSFVYTNTTSAALAAIEFHLMLPSVVTLQPSTEGELDWHCAPASAVQQLCSFSLEKLEPGATRRAPFVLELAAPARLKELHTLVVAVYAVRDGHILYSDVAAVPVRPDLTENFPIFLPLIANQLP